MWKKGILLLMLPGFVFASPADCYRIKDKDAQSYCLATTGHRSIICYQIRNEDQKRLCLAEIQGNTSTCFQIRDEDTRNLCLAKLRK